MHYLTAIAILEDHDIDFKHENDQLYAFALVGQQQPDGSYKDVSHWVNITSWSQAQLMKWLGY